jgi:hypothetical protein
MPRNQAFSNRIHIRPISRLTSWMGCLSFSAKDNTSDRGNGWILRRSPRRFKQDLLAGFPSMVIQARSLSEYCLQPMTFE